MPRGSIVALIGPNGAGKTTCFNLIAGVYKPDTGRIRLDGADITGLRPDQVCNAGIGRTFQIVRPFNGLSVVENVMVGALHRSADVAAARHHALEILERLGLAGEGVVAGECADPAGAQAARDGAGAGDRAQDPAARRGDGRAAAGRDRPHGRDLHRRSRARPGSPSSSPST